MPFDPIGTVISINIRVVLNTSARCAETVVMEI